MSKENQPSAETLAAFVANILRADPEAEKEFRANPKKFLEEKSGKKIPAGVQVKIQENSDKTWHIPLGGKSGPLDKVQLDNVSGGIKGYDLTGIDPTKEWLYSDDGPTQAWLDKELNALLAKKRKSASPKKSKK